MKMHKSLCLSWIVAWSLGGVLQCVAADEPAKPVPQRVLAAPSFPDSFADRSWDKGEMETDLGPAKFQDMIVKHDGMTLTLRRFMVPPKTWDLKTPKAMLDGARDHMVQGDETTKLESEKDFVVDGFPGRTFIFTHEEKGVKSVMRMDYFLLKPDVFIYCYTGPKAGLESKDVVEFFKGIKTMEAKPEPEKERETKKDTE